MKTAGEKVTLQRELNENISDIISISKLNDLQTATKLIKEQFNITSKEEISAPINEVKEDELLDKWQGYFPKCHKVINTNMQGNEIGNHICTTDEPIKKEDDETLWNEVHYLILEMLSYSALSNIDAKSKYLVSEIKKYYTIKRKL